jgi:hypothetical protein
VKRLTVLVILAILVAGLILLGLSDAAFSIADTGTSNNEVTSTSNSSASATITTTMYTVDMVDYGE